MNKHKIFLTLLFFLVFSLAVANSFFSSEFMKPTISDLSLSQLTIGLFMIIIIYYNFFYSDSYLWKFLAPLLLLSIYSLISVIWSPFPFIAIVFSLKLFFLVNVFIIAASLVNRKLLTDEKLIVIAKIVILITVAGQIVGHLLGVTTYKSEFSTAGLSDNVSTISGQLLFAVPAIFIGGFKRRTDFLYILLIVFSNIYTLRRSTFISLLLVLGIVFIFNFFSQSITTRMRLQWSVISVATVVLLVLFLTETQIGEAFFTRFIELNPNKGGTASGRYEFQYLGLIYSINRDFVSMLFGGGFGHSVAVNVNNGFIPIGMHNDFLDIFIGLGIIGLGFLFWFLKRLWDLTKKFVVGDPYFNASISFLVVIITLGIFSGGFYETKTILGYLTLGLIYSKIRDNDYQSV